MGASCFMGSLFTAIGQMARSAGHGIAVAGRGAATAVGRLCGSIGRLGGSIARGGTLATNFIRNIPRSTLTRLRGIRGAIAGGGAGARYSRLPAVLFEGAERVTMTSKVWRVMSPALKSLGKG